MTRTNPPSASGLTCFAFGLHYTYYFTRALQMIISRCNDHHRHLSAPHFALTFCIFAVCWLGVASRCKSKLAACIVAAGLNAMLRKN
jgi:hypothetical protein